MIIPRRNITFRFGFPPEAQAEREPVLHALERAMAERAMAERSAKVVRAAQALAAAWLTHHSEDCAV